MDGKCSDDTTLPLLTSGRQKAQPECTSELGAGLKRWGPVSILSAPENRVVVGKLLRYMAVTAAAPVGVFFLVRDLQPPHRYRDSTAAVAAVLTLNCCIAAYVIMAFLEPTPAGPKVTRLGRWADPREE